MQIQRAADAAPKYEYGCDLRRLYPWTGVAGPGWGSAIASVRPGECTTPHAHDELETFLVLEGSGRMEIEDEHEVLHRGDVVLIPKDREHRFQNLSDRDPLVFLTIFWDSPEARARLSDVLDQGSDDL
jgi:mannose-6-phosphate isomerase-like protein (cupin superfamily)